MATNESLRCDGCGQAASPEHVARRLQRLEWATRYRPVHIGALFLGATAPQNDSDFLYRASGQFTGEGAAVLKAVRISAVGKPTEAVLTEFQRGGFFLAHALECAIEANAATSETQRLLVERLPLVLARIRRSLKPKKLVPISRLLEPFLRQIKPDELGCSVLCDNGKPFSLDGQQAEEALGRLREALTNDRVGGLEHAKIL